MKPLRNSQILEGMLGIIASFLSVVMIIWALINVRPTFNGLFAGLAGVVLGAIIAYVLALTIKEKPSAKVFLSYAPNDAEFANRLSKDLINSGFQVLKTRNVVLVGDNIQDKILDAIQNADFFVTILSMDALESQWISQELEIAKNRSKKVFPVLKEKINLSPPLAEIQCADFSTDYDTAIASLAHSLRTNLRTSKSPPG